MPSPTIESDRFAWTLGQTSPPREAVTASAIDAACAFVTGFWQVAPTIVPRLLEWAGDDRAAGAALDAVQDLAIATRALTRMQNLLCLRFARVLGAEDIPYVLLKGSAIRLVAYPHPEDRGGLDVDVGVPARHLAAAERIARRQGFVPASLDETGRHFFQVTAREKHLAERGHYELACLVRKQVVGSLDPEVAAAVRRSIGVLRPWHVTDAGEIGCYVTLDVHHGLCLDIDVDEAVATARTHRVAGGGTVNVPQPEWLLLHLIFKLYWEGVHNYRKGAYQYADIVRLVPRIRGKSAARLFGLLDEYRLQAAAHYVLRRVEPEFGVSLPKELGAYVASASIPPSGVFPTDVNDMGDMWPKIWGRR